MNDHETMVGTATWVQETSGWLTPAARRAMLLPLVRGHLTNASGRLRLLLRLHPGRNAYVPPGRLAPPDSVLTREARAHAVRILPIPLLNHSYRTYQFGRALGEIEGVEVDTELLFAASMLHDVGLRRASWTTLRGSSMYCRSAQRLVTQLRWAHGNRLTRSCDTSRGRATWNKCEISEPIAAATCGLT